MSVIIAPSLSERVYQGPQGNESVAEGSITLSAAAPGDIVQLLDFPIGMRINSVQVVSDALGEEVKVEIKSGDTVLVPADDFSSAVATVVPVQPYMTQSDGELLTATISGGAAAGKLVVLIRYVAVGY
ncbi:Putative phage protein [Paramixta manurensis]|uniref:Phage protein n=1 Tax=Paramixta manurensis TaxID=2740817 RepID=A0A6M8UEP4_9GAMM|nr:Putative phage protein [Erwiniaceae bacterium PD-1]